MLISIKEATKELEEININDIENAHQTIDFLKNAYKNVKLAFFKTCITCFEISSRDSYCNCKIESDFWENEIRRTELINFINLYEDSTLNLRLLKFSKKFNEYRNKEVENIINGVFKIIVVNPIEDKNYYLELEKNADYSLMENYSFSRLESDYLDSISILDQLLFLIKFDNNTVKFLKGFCEMKLLTISDNGPRFYDDNLEMFKDLIDAINDNWYLNYLIGYTYSSMNCTARMLCDDVVSYLDNCIDKNPIFHNAYFYRAIAKESLNSFGYDELKVDPISIFNDYEKCIEINPYKDDAYCRLGRAILLYDRYSDCKINRLNALTNYDKAIILNKENHFALYSRSLLYLELNELTKAMLDIESAIAVEVFQEYYVLKAKINIKLGHLILALKDYDKVCFMDCNSYSFWDERADLIKKIKEKGLFDENLVIDFNNWRETMGI